MLIVITPAGNGKIQATLDDFAVLTKGSHRIDVNCNGVKVNDAAAFRNEKGETVLVVGNLEPFMVRFAQEAPDA